MSFFSDFVTINSMKSEVWVDPYLLGAQYCAPNKNNFYTAQHRGMTPGCGDWPTSQ